MEEVWTKYTGKGGLDSQRREASKIFDPEKEYKIIGGYIGKYDSGFEFEGIRGYFNTVMFDKRWEDAEHLMERPNEKYI